MHVRDVSPNEDDAPLAKRARKFSDADQASAHQIVAHESSPCLMCHRWRGKIVVSRFHPVHSCKDFPSTWSGIRRTYKWRVGSFHTQCIAAQVCSMPLSTIRTLKRMKGATPFRFPVNPEALKMPYYPQIIKHPMDFSTIERKLLASNSAQPGPNLRCKSDAPATLTALTVKDQTTNGRKREKKKACHTLRGTKS